MSMYQVVRKKNEDRYGFGYKTHQSHAQLHHFRATRSKITDIFGRRRRIRFPSVAHPRLHINEIGHVTRYFTLHDGAITANYVFIFRLRKVTLRNHLIAEKKKTYVQRWYKFE